MAPSCPKHVFHTERKDEQNAGHGEGVIEGRERRAPDIGPDRPFFIIHKMGLIFPAALFFASVYPIGDSAGYPVKDCRAQASGAFLVK